MSDKQKTTFWIAVSVVVLILLPIELKIFIISVMIWGFLVEKYGK